MLAEARMFLILIRIFSNSHPKYMLKMLLLGQAFIWKVSTLKFQVRRSFLEKISPQIWASMLW